MPWRHVLNDQALHGALHNRSEEDGNPLVLETRDTRFDTWAPDAQGCTYW